VTSLLGVLIEILEAPPKSVNSRNSIDLEGLDSDCLDSDELDPDGLDYTESFPELEISS
jgi:hypothetical protein